ncbi:uncharacterized protein [Typha latifolia]|uniref:uncharacterized protein n=1 Tax=Typha latifolia TaxID=4733 RepID=UPI003C2C7B85
MESSNAKHRSWRITVKARSKGLDLRFSAANVFPSWGKGGERISVFLLLRRFFFLILSVECENREAVPAAKPRARFFRFLGKLFGSRKGVSRRSKNASPPQISDGRRHWQGPVAVIMGNLYLLSHSAAEKDSRGITIYALSYIFYLILLFRTRKTHFSSILLTNLVSLIGFSLSYLSYTDLVSKAAWLVWTKLVFFGCSLALSQVVLSRNHLALERGWIMLFIFFTSILLILFKMNGAIIFQSIGIMIYAATAWIPNILFTSQVFSYILGKPKAMDALGVYVSSAYFWGKEISKYFMPFLQEWMPKINLLKFYSH